ncbi:MAG: hypothetical protein LBP26_02495 [Clostridiales bacterium]|jgi:hypothetical protein|nr:hypothetical protein [Clostridiales bacterium]
MAKKVNKKTVIKSGGIKKKKRGCLGCFITALIVFVAVLGAGGGVGWYFGDKWTKANLDMSLGDCPGVAWDITHSNEKKLVTNGFSDADKVKFETGLKNQLFLKQSAELNADALLGAAGAPTGTAAKNALLNSVLSAGGGAPQTDVMTSFLSSLITPENLDKDKLAAYDQSKHGEYILSFNGKELAGFLNTLAASGIEMYNSLDGSNGVKTAFEEYGVQDISSLARFDQVKIYGTPAEPHISMTLSVDVRKYAAEQLKRATGWNLGWALNMILPKRLFFTADLNLGETAQIKLYVNNTDEAKMQRLYKLVRGAMSLGGSPLDVEGIVNDAAAPFIQPAADVIRTYFDTSSVADGTLKVDLLEMAIELSGINDGKEETPELILTSSDVIYMLKDVVTSSFDNAIDTKHTWKDNYYENGTETIVYKKTDVAGGDVLVNYEELVMDELADKYLIKRTDENGDPRTFADLMRLFSMAGGDNTGDLLSWVDPDRMGELSQRDKSGLKVTLNDQMLGAVFNSQLNSVAGEGAQFADMNPQVYQIHVSSVTENGVTRKFMEAGISMSVAGALGSMGGMSGVASGILGENIMVRFKMEVTTGVPEGYVYAPSSMRLNDLDDAAMNRLMTTFKKLGVGFSRDGMIGSIERPMRDALVNMGKQMPGLAIEESKILMADLFDITADKMLTHEVTDSDTGEVTTEPITFIVAENEIDDPRHAADWLTGASADITGAELQRVLKKLYGASYDSPVLPDSHIEFLRDVRKNYFLKNIILPGEAGYVVPGGEGYAEDGGKVHVANYNGLTNYFSIDALDADKVDKDKMMHTPESNQNLRPFVNESELGGLILGMMKEKQEDDFFNFTDLIGFDIQVGQDYERIVLTVRVATAAMFENGQQGDFERFINIDYFYSEITIDLSDTLETGTDDARYASDYTVSGMDKNELAIFLAVVAKFNTGAQQIGLAARATDLGKFMYKQINDFAESMGDSFEFTDDGLYIASLFDLIANAQTPPQGQTKPDGETVKAALQGLYDNEYTVNETPMPASAYNYAGALFGDNPIDAAYTISGTTIADYQLGGIVEAGVNSGDGISLSELNIYTVGRSAPSDYAASGNFAVTDYADNKNYIELVFSITNWNAIAASDNKYSGFIPSAVYITLLLEKDQSGYSRAKVGTDDFIRINNLSKPAQDVLVNIANVNMTDIDTQIDGYVTFITQTSPLFQGSHTFGTATRTINGGSAFTVGTFNISA